MVHIGLEIVLQKNITNHTVSNLVIVVATRYRHAKIGTTSVLIMEEAVLVTY